VASEVRIRAKGTKDVVSTAYQEPTLNISSPSLEMRFCEDLCLPIGLWQAQAPGICSHGSTLHKARRILKGEHERECCKCSNPLNLPQELGFRVVVLLADRF
jgi:hypothetical protein